MSDIEDLTRAVERAAAVGAYLHAHKHQYSTTLLSAAYSVWEAVEARLTWEEKEDHDEEGTD